MRGTIKEFAASVLIRAQLEIRRELVFLRTQFLMDTLKMISFSQNNLKGEMKHQDIIRSLNKEVLDVHISDF